jgi:hypothetical protein
LLFWRARALAPTFLRRLLRRENEIFTGVVNRVRNLHENLKYVKNKSKSRF